MRLKPYILFMLLPCLAACESFSEARKAGEFAPITVNFSVASTVPEVTSVVGMDVSILNPDEDIAIRAVLDGPTLTVEGVPPGIYTVSIGGIATGSDGNTYKLNQTRSSLPLVSDGQSVDFELDGMMFSPLVFKELYWSLSKLPNSNTNYNFDQFYEIYNNSDQTYYLDGLLFVDLFPISPTANFPNLLDQSGNAVDRDRYTFGRWVWQFPGSGTDYPLEPGESVVLAQSAVNHQLDMYNPNSPIDLYTAEFEFWTNHANGNQPALDMHLYFYNNLRSIPRFYLSANSGGAYGLVRIPDDVAAAGWDPQNDARWQARNNGAGNPYAMIPVEWVLEAVECGLNADLITNKRLPGVLDEGLAWVGPSGSGKSIARRISEFTNINGDPVYVDTNNSSTDFLLDPDDPSQGMARTPEIRRNGARMPAWNFTHGQ